MNRNADPRLPAEARPKASIDGLRSEANTLGVTASSEPDPRMDYPHPTCPCEGASTPNTTPNDYRPAQSKRRQ